MISLPLTMFALRHTSGVYMPDKTGSAGGTYINPFTERSGQTKHPRLFSTPGAAKAALKWWAGGKVQMSNPHWMDAKDDGGRDIAGQKKVPGREASEWSVVPVVIREATP